MGYIRLIFLVLLIVTMTANADRDIRFDNTLEYLSEQNKENIELDPSVANIKKEDLIKDHNIYEYPVENFLNFENIESKEEVIKEKIPEDEYFTDSIIDTDNFESLPDIRKNRFENKNKNSKWMENEEGHFKLENEPYQKIDKIHRQRGRNGRNENGNRGKNHKKGKFQKIGEKEFEIEAQRMVRDHENLNSMGEEDEFDFPSTENDEINKEKRKNPHKKFNKGRHGRKMQSEFRLSEYLKRNFSAEFSNLTNYYENNFNYSTSTEFNNITLYNNLTDYLNTDYFDDLSQNNNFTFHNNSFNKYNSTPDIDTQDFSNFSYYSNISYPIYKNISNLMNAEAYNSVPEGGLAFDHLNFTNFRENNHWKVNSTWREDNERKAKKVARPPPPSSSRSSREPDVDREENDHATHRHGDDVADFNDSCRHSSGLNYYICYIPTRSAFINIICLAIFFIAIIVVLVFCFKKIIAFCKRINISITYLSDSQVRQSANPEENSNNDIERNARNGEIAVNSTASIRTDNNQGRIIPVGNQYNPYNEIMNQNIHKLNENLIHTTPVETEKRNNYDINKLGDY